MKKQTLKKGKKLFLAKDLVKGTNLLMLQPDYPKNMVVTVKEALSSGVYVEEIPGIKLSWSFLSLEKKG